MRANFLDREHWKKMLPIIQAFVDGKTILHDKYSSDAFSFDSAPESYRIKPEPKLRPWKPEEVPVGALVRQKSIGPNVWRRVILLVTEESIALVHRTQIMLYLLNELTDFEHSLDGGKIWLPCGVLE